jgi:hypothetical protein
MAPGGGARRGPTPAVPRAARLPAPVAATGQVAARGARASADPHARDRGRAADERLPLGLPAPRGPPLGPDVAGTTRATAALPTVYSVQPFSVIFEIIQRARPQARR